MIIICSAFTVKSCTFEVLLCYFMIKCPVHNVRANKWILHLKYHHALKRYNKRCPCVFLYCSNTIGNIILINAWSIMNRYSDVNIYIYIYLTL